MSLAKSEGSSHHKGKETTIDPPPIEGEVGEETPLSESECFKEERTARDLDRECPPLIDPWYDTHSHFLVIPSDYSPFPSSRVWLSLER